MAVRLSHGEVTTDWRGLEDPRVALAEADARMYEAKHARYDALTGPDPRPRRLPSCPA